MNIIFWNVRGIENLDTRLVLQKACVHHKLNLLFIAEPWIALDQIQPSFWMQLKLKPFIVNVINLSLPNLWGFCAENLYPTVIASSSQQISISIQWESDVCIYQQYMLVLHI